MEELRRLGLDAMAWAWRGRNERQRRSRHRIRWAFVLSVFQETTDPAARFRAVERLKKRMARDVETRRRKLEKKP